MSALEQVRAVIKALQTTIMILLAKIVSNINLKTSTIPERNGQGCASADWYSTVHKIHTKICKGERQVKMESRIFLRNIFCKLLSKYLWQSLFSVKSHAFNIFFWTPLDGCASIIKIVLWEVSYFRRCKNNQTTKVLLRKLLDNKNEGCKCYLGKKEQKAMFLVVSQSDV